MLRTVAPVAVLVVLACYLQLCTAYQDVPAKSYKVTKYHMVTTTQDRFARTSITAVYQSSVPASNGTDNPDTKGQPIDFTINVPSKAAISGMTLTEGNRTNIGVVMEREIAQGVYQAAADAGTATGIVETRDMKAFDLQFFLPHGATVTLNLEYDAVLLRSESHIKMKLHVPSTAFLQDIRIIFDVKDSLAQSITDVSSPNAPYGFGKTFTWTHTAAYQGFRLEYRSPGNLESWGPTGSDSIATPPPELTHYDISYQPVLKPSALAGVITAQDGYFAHVFSPNITVPGQSETQVLPSDVVFVIDYSGSMGGSRIAMAKQAFVAMIASLPETSAFNVISYSNTASLLWSQTQAATAARKEEAGTWVTSRQAGGSTNSYDALEKALTSLDNGAGDRLPLVVFLSDGVPTGPIDDIHVMVRRLNINEATIFTLGFDAPDRGVQFMRQLAAENGGRYRTIYAGSDAATQLLDFWGTIDKPVLANVDVTYAPASSASSSSSSSSDGGDMSITWHQDRSDRIYYTGSEILVVGRVTGGSSPTATLPIKATVSGKQGGSSAWSSTLQFDARPSLQSDPPRFPGLARRLYHIKRISDTLELLRANETPELKYNITIMSLRAQLIVPDVTDMVGMPQAKAEKIDIEAMVTNVTCERCPGRTTTTTTTTTTNGTSATTPTDSMNATSPSPSTTAAVSPSPVPPASNSTSPPPQPTTTTTTTTTLNYTQSPAPVPLGGSTTRLGPVGKAPAPGSPSGASTTRPSAPGGSSGRRRANSAASRLASATASVTWWSLSLLCIVFTLAMGR